MLILHLSTKQLLIAELFAIGWGAWEDFAGAAAAGVAPYKRSVSQLYNENVNVYVNVNVLFIAVPLHTGK